MCFYCATNIILLRRKYNIKNRPNQGDFSNIEI